MNTKAKKVIKGIAKTTGKYTLKGLTKGAELAARGSLKTLDVLVTNPSLQKIVTTAGLLTAGVMIPAVGTTLISTLGLKYMVDNALLGKKKGLGSEIRDIVNAGNVLTEGLCNGVFHKAIKGLDKNIKEYRQARPDKNQ